MDLIEKVHQHSENADNYEKEINEINVNSEMNDEDKTRAIRILNDKIINEKKEYRHIIHVINIKLVNIDNAINRHNMCKRDTCLRRKDGTICTTCKYQFPHDISDKSKIILK